ncbi:D-alanyl-D-alanine carboxypeptidase family protein [Agrilactobacillus yilanensis]|uniref:D-alanyl-D-alanine carboxypeptidase family protein n=1 Tax=Agrilactobacillus yilanensis TaxID=2485997 RepID=A0ABW4J8A6_9LACO|nr:D-alanyl-D-alanine carboxypeptidase family protein [Agrilactobacillus yilanensis]
MITKRRITPLYLLILSFSLLIGLLAFSTQSVQAAAPANFNPDNYAVNAKAAVVLDAKSGQVLYAKEASTALPVASMSKMISLYLVLKAIDQGKIQWTDTIAPDEAQAALSEGTELSNVPLTAGTAYTVKELYEASWIYSANVAVMLLGQKVAGSQANFVKLMQQQLTDWGIKDATIVNASGLNNSLLGDLAVPGTGADAENEMSAYDTAQVAQHVLADYPEVLQTTKIAKQTFRANQAGSFEMTNWNMLLPGLQMYDASLAIDGLKTGTSDAAGECFTATLKVNGRRLIAVVMNAQGAADDKTKRFVATAGLLKATLASWQYDTVLTAQKALPNGQKLKVINGRQKYVTLTAAKTQKFWQLRSAASTQGQLKLKKAYRQGITAPVKANQVIGQYQLAKPDYIFVQAQPKTAVMTEKAVTKLPWYQILFNKIF